jgi:hypothetical protein
MYAYQITLDPNQIKPSYQPHLIIVELSFGESRNQKLKFTNGMIIVLNDEPRFINNEHILDAGTRIIIQFSSKNKQYCVTPEIKVAQFITLSEYLADPSLQ